MPDYLLIIKTTDMETTGYLGIDVSKGYADFLLLDGQKNVIEESFMLQDNHSGREQLKKVIDGWFSQGLEILFCGVESTGGYENNWYHALKGWGRDGKLHVARLNPRGVKSVSDASLKRTITDAVSAENIASYLICFPEKIAYGIKGLGEGKFKEGRHHNTYVRMLIKQKVQLNNQLEKLLYQHFSEVLVYCRNGLPTWLLRLLTMYPSAAGVLKAGSAKLENIKGVSSDKARSLIQKASVSNRVVGKQLQHVIASTAKEILHKDALIGDEKKYLTAIYDDDDQVKLIVSIPGIGVESAVIIILEIEEIERFKSAKSLSAYFGVHPSFKQSGDGIWANHMSKKGRSTIRAVLYMTALAGIRHNPLIKQLYARFRAKGMKHNQAMGVVMHKLLRIIYGVLKNKKGFDITTDQKNVSCAEERQKDTQETIKSNNKKIKEKRNRYQLLTIEAPISRIAEQKIRKQMASQAS